MATVKISQLPPASGALSSTDVFPAVQSGTTVKATSGLLSYQPSGAGAVTTTIQAKLRQIVSVKDFGAVGDGVTDDTAAGTAALATGKSIYWPTGTYKVSPIASPAPHSEPNRTSAWELADGQVMFGDGAQSKLLWGTPATRQCFFKAADCVDVALRNLSFDGGYSSIIVDPDTDGSVDGVVVENCYFENLLIDVLGGNQLAIDSSSKYAKNITVRGCSTAGPTVHSVLFTNCYNAQATGNQFNNVTGGFCVNASQGSRNVIISNNTADTCDYFCKVESSDTAAVNPAKFASHEIVIANNTAINVDIYGIFINGAADHISVTGNVMVGFSNTGVFLDQVVSYSHTGAVVVSGNVLSAAPASTNAIGINDALSTGTSPHVFADNVIDEVLIGIKISRKNAVITGGSLVSDSSCIVLNVPAIIDGVVICGVKMKGAGGVNADGVGQPVKRLTVTGCDIDFTGAAIFTNAATSQSIFSNNTITSAAPTVGGIVLTSPTNCSIQNNTLNLNGTSVDAITNSTAINDSIVVGNICTRPITLVSPSAGTINTGNITNAAYVA